MGYKLSIVMPLFGKARYTERYVKYFAAESPSEVKLMLFDADRQLEARSFDFPNNVVVDSVFMDKTPQTYVKSMNEMLSKVDTEFVMLNDNDDFPNFLGMLEVMKLLEGDSSLAWAGGKIGHFFNSTYNSTVFLRDKTGRGYRTVQEKLSGKYQYEWYNVFRTTALKQLFEKMEESHPVEWSHLEVFQALYCSLQKGIYSDNYIYIREILVTNSSASLIKKGGSHQEFVKRTVGILRDTKGAVDGWDAEQMLLKFMLIENDRRRMYLAQFIKSILFHLGLLSFIDRRLARHKESSELEFVRAIRLISQYYAVENK